MPLTPEGNPCCAGAFGRATSSRFLIVGPERPSKQKPPSGSAALLFFRPAAGAPRRLRQHYASCLVERYAHDREAVVWLIVVMVMIAAMCEKQSCACGSSLVLQWEFACAVFYYTRGIT